MANDFFEEEKVDEQTEQVEQPEAIKLGEKEYTQEELQKLVGLGEQARELEEKWDTRIDRLMPEYSKTREELKSLRSQAESKAQERIEAKQEQGQELSEDEKARLVREELKRYGVMTREDFEAEYANRRAGEKLLEKTEKVISTAVGEGKPKATTEELLTYMAETGVRNPNDAYELMFKKQIREMELAKLQSIKPQGIWTESSSTAGAKTPQPVSVTKDNLHDVLGEVLSRSGGQ